MIWHIITSNWENINNCYLGFINRLTVNKIIAAMAKKSSYCQFKLTITLHQVKTRRKRTKMPMAYSVHISMMTGFKSGAAILTTLPLQEKKCWEMVFRFVRMEQKLDMSL